MEAALQAGHHFRGKPALPAHRLNGRAGFAQPQTAPHSPPSPPAPCVLGLSQGLELNAFWMAASQADTQVVRGVGRVRQRCQLA